MTARLNNNKGNKVTSALKADIACSRLSSSRNIRRIPALHRRGQTGLVKFFNYYRACQSISMSDNVPTTAMPPTSAKETVRIALPDRLPRPVRGEANMDIIRKICPELDDVPPQFVRNSISKLSTHFYAGILTATIISSPASLPSELQVIISDSHLIHPICPTHVLALTSSLPCQPSSGSPKKFTLFPTHQLILAANCSQLPAFPSSPTAVPNIKTSDRVTVPVVRLSMPYPEHFGTLQWYLYTKDTAGLRKMIFSRDWNTSISNTLKTAQLVYGIWANSVALKVVEPEIFIILEEAWTEITAQLTTLTTSSSSSSSP